MIKKNKIFSLTLSLFMGFSSLTFLPQFNIFAEKVSLDEASNLTISSPDNSYTLVLNKQDCQKVAKLIREHLNPDLNILYKERRQSSNPRTDAQNKKIISSSINCLRFILMHIGGLKFVEASKIIKYSFFQYTSYDNFNSYVYRLLNTLDIL